MTTWSHSALKDFEQCARKYAEVRIFKRVKREETEQSIYGTELHTAAEAYGKTKVADPKFSYIYPIMDALLAKPGHMYFEHEMALDEALAPCDWKSPKAWVRGIADFMKVDNAKRRARCVDLKTGSDKYADTDQLDLMALLIFAHFPAVLEVKGALIFVLKGRMVKHNVRYEDKDALWWRYRERVAKIDAAKENGVWNPTQSGLCKKHCAVVSCPFNGRH